MPIPFLQPKKVAGMILARKGKPDVQVSAESEAKGGEANPELKSAMADLLSAIERKSVLDMVKAYQDADRAMDADEDCGPEMDQGA